MNLNKYTRNMTDGHGYIINVAADVGVNSAVLFSNILYWVRHNKANNQNFHEGKFWTYNSRKAWAELFPEFSEDQVKRSLAKLKESGYIVTGDFNQNPYDHTLWYSLSDQAESVFLTAENELSNKSSTGEISNIDRVKSPNRLGISAQSCLGEIAQSTNTNIASSDIKPNINSSLTPLFDGKEEKEDLSVFVDLFHELCPRMQKIRKLSPKRQSALNARLSEYSKEDIETVFRNAGQSDFLNGKNNQGWKADFDWLLNPNHFLKVLEGGYQGKGKTVDNSKWAMSKELSQEERMADNYGYGVF